MASHYKYYYQLFLQACNSSKEAELLVNRAQLASSTTLPAVVLCVARDVSAAGHARLLQPSLHVGDGTGYHHCNRYVFIECYRRMSENTGASLIPSLRPTHRPFLDHLQCVKTELEGLGAFIM